MAGYITPEDLYLFAITTGDLYEDNCRRARNTSSVWVWRSYVKGALWTRYKREIDGNACMHSQDMQTVASRLQDYYTAHVAEVSAVNVTPVDPNPKRWYNVFKTPDGRISKLCEVTPHPTREKALDSALNFPKNKRKTHLIGRVTCRLKEPQP